MHNRLKSFLKNLMPLHFDEIVPFLHIFHTSVPKVHIGSSLSDQHLSPSVNQNMMTDLQRFTQIVLKLRTAILTKFFEIQTKKSYSNWRQNMLI